MAIFRTNFVSILVFIIFTSITSSPTSHSLNDPNIKHLFPKLSWFGGFNKPDNCLINSDLARVFKTCVNTPLTKAESFWPNLKDRIKETRNDSIWKGKYESCNMNYKDAIGKLNDLKKKLKKPGDYNVCVPLKDAHEDIKSCLNMLKNALAVADKKRKLKPINGIQILQETTILDSLFSDAEKTINAHGLKKKYVKGQVHVMGIK